MSTVEASDGIMELVFACLFMRCFLWFSSGKVWLIFQ